MDNISDISKMLQTEGAKKGYTPEQISKTIKMIKKGKLNLENFAPMITDKLTNGMKSDNPSRTELKNRLHKKIAERSSLRTRKKDIQNNKDTGITETINVTKKTNKKKNQNKRLNKLAKKYGTITPEVYFDALKHINEYTALDRNLSNEEIIEKNRYKNIIAIYDKQNISQDISTLSDDDISIDEDLSDISE